MNTRVREFVRVVAVALVAVLVLPQAVLAAEESKQTWTPWFLTAGRLFNLAVVVAILVWVARRPLANFYFSRSESIKEQLAEALKAREEAERKLAEMESRMSRMDEELGVLRTEAEKTAHTEYERLVAAADRDASKLVDRAKQEIDGMTRAAQLELRAYAANLSIKMAEERIRGEITDADRNRLVADFIGDLKEKS